MRCIAVAMAAALGLAPLAGRAQDAQTPELEFLEYLGSWQEDDDEWVLVAEWDEDEQEQTDDRRGRQEPGPDAKPEAGAPDGERKDDE